MHVSLINVTYKTTTIIITETITITKIISLLIFIVTIEGVHYDAVWNFTIIDDSLMDFNRKKLNGRSLNTTTEVYAAFNWLSTLASNSPAWARTSSKHEPSLLRIPFYSSHYFVTRKDKSACEMKRWRHEFRALDSFNYSAVPSSSERVWASVPWSRSLDVYNKTRIRESKSDRKSFRWQGLCWTIIQNQPTHSDRQKLIWDVALFCSESNWEIDQLGNYWPFDSDGKLFYN